MEIWKTYDNMYSISSSGQVKNHITDKIIKQQKTVDGYSTVKIHGKRMRAHRLVAQLFCENPHGHNEVDHIDRNQSNNHATNLRWCSRFENAINNGKRNYCEYIKNGNVYYRVSFTIEPGFRVRNHFVSEEDAIACVNELKTKHRPTI